MSTLGLGQADMLASALRDPHMRYAIQGFCELQAAYYRDRAAEELTRNESNVPKATELAFFSKAYGTMFAELENFAKNQLKLATG